MFDFYKTLDLAYLGDNWKDCYIKFRAVTVSEIGQFTGLKEKDSADSIKVIVALLEEKFVEGYAMKNGERVALKKEDIKEFPVDILTDVINLFSESISKKKLNPSTTASEV